MLNIPTMWEMTAKIPPKTSQQCIQNHPRQCPLMAIHRCSHKKRLQQQNLRQQHLFCVSSAAREVLQRSSNRISAILWYDFCILRYSNAEEIQKQMKTWQLSEIIGQHVDPTLV
ncbi:hypothetical protein VNO80_25993 [Phaseolus coccineus]|uniref:Uncharacterized protein n=1 Tax=Phaseolus coccineus TaxID=3886 RepID=A0AAN9LW94_PHACN